MDAAWTTVALLLVLGLALGWRRLADTARLLLGTPSQLPASAPVHRWRWAEDAVRELRGQGVPHAESDHEALVVRGVVGPIRVSLDGRTETGMWTVLRASLPEGALPPWPRPLDTFDLGLPPLDEPRAVAAIARAVGEGSFGQLHSRWVELRHEGILLASLAEAVRQADALAQALAGAESRRWSAWAAERGFSEDGWRFRKAAGAVAVAVRPGAWEERGGRRVGLELHVDRPLPRGLRARARAPGEPDAGLRLGDPVLDPRVTLEGAPEQAVRRLFADPELRAALLALLLGRPGSRLAGGRVLLELVVHHPDEVDEPLADALAVARGLEGASA